MKNRWITKIINLAAGQVYQHECFQTCNTFLIRNTGNGFIYADLVSSFTTANADVVVPGNAWGTLVNPNNFKTVYMLATVDTQVKVVEAYTENPAILVGSMTDMAGAVNVAVTSTVGLMADSLDLSPAGVLGVDMSPGLPQNVSIFNIPMAVINTEYSQALPAGTKEVILSVRKGEMGQNFRIAFEAGKVAGSISPFFEVDSGTGFVIDGLNLNGKTLFFAGSKANQILQIICKF